MNVIDKNWHEGELLKIEIKINFRIEWTLLFIVIVAQSFHIGDFRWFT